MRRPDRALGLLLLAVLPAVLLTGCGADPRQVSVCERLIPWFEGADTPVDIVREEKHPAAAHGVIIDYRRPDQPEDKQNHWIACRFAGGAFDPDRLKLTAVATDRKGTLSDIELGVLRYLWLGYFEPEWRQRAER